MKRYPSRLTQIVLTVLTVLIAAALPGAAHAQTASTPEMPTTPETPTTPTLVPATGDVLTRPKIIAAMRKVADYQLAHLTGKDNNWIRSTLFTGVLATYTTTHDEKYLDATIQWGKDHNWTPSGDQRFADYQCCGQDFAELFFLKHDPAMIAPIRAAVDKEIATAKPGRVDWWWCDSLYMAPPMLVRLYAATGDRKYIAYLDDMYWDTTDFLYDKSEHLFFRDKNFFDAKTKNGKKVFWSRGNGWVMGGLVRILQYLPQDNPKRKDYVKLHQDMCAKIASLQGPDGLWRPSLLDPDEFPQPETSGTGFDCYAIAWGINNGTLDRAKYLPVAEKAWRGLLGAVNEEGKLGWVQRVAGAPGKVNPNDTMEYAVGAFLLAGSEMAKLNGIKYDIGTGPVENGWNGVGLDQYTADLGYGWLDPKRLILRDRPTAPDALRRDYVYSHAPATFRINVAPGLYKLTLVMGDERYDNHVTRASVDVPGVTLPEVRTKLHEYATVTAGFPITKDTLDISFDGPTKNWQVNAISLEPATAPEAPKVTKQNFDKAADMWGETAKLPDQIAPYLKRFRADMRRVKGFRPTGLTRNDYLRLIAGEVDYYKRHQNAQGAIIDPYKHVEVQYATPCFAYAAATLIKYAGRKDLVAPAVKAMDWAILTLSEGRAATHHEDFFSEQIGHGMPMLKPYVSAAQYATWEKRIRDFDPFTVYRQAPGANNWNVVALSGEYLFHKLGLRPDISFITTSLTAQGHFFQSGHGLYLEGPMAYDLFPRIWASDMIAQGYNGPHAKTLSEYLRRGALTSLFMQSPNGELPAGGRSAYHQWNEAEQSMVYEIWGARAHAQGDDELAAVFKREAHLALSSMRRWVRPDGAIYILKNRVDPAKMHAYESYSAFSNYGNLPMAILANAYQYAATTEGLKEKPAPADVGGFVLPVPELHKVFANAGGMYAEIDTSGDFHYDATGLIRIHKAGFDPQLGPSDTLTTEQVYNKPDGSPKTQAAVGAAWKDLSGQWTRLAGYNSAEFTRVSLMDAQQAPDRVSFQLLYQGYMGGQTVVSERYTVTPQSVELSTEIPGYTGPMEYVWPVHAENGADSVDIRVKNGTVFARRGASTETFTPIGASAISVGKAMYPNHNGWSRVATALYPNGGRITLRILPKEGRAK